MIDPAIYQGFVNCRTTNAWEKYQSTWFTFRKGEDDVNSHGTPFFSLECDGGQASVHRARYLDELVALVPEEIAHFGKKLEHAEDKGDHVVLHFHDGTTATHSAVIGCDGVRSRTRAVLLGENNPVSHPSFSGKYAYRGLIPMEDAAGLLGEELARNSQMYLGHGGHMLTFPIEHGRTMNVVAFATKQDGHWADEQWVIPVDREAMMRDFSGWISPVQSILRMMRHSDVWALFDLPPAPTYFSNRICVLGDAAHASTPHNGAGAGQAIEDALCMSRVMSLVFDGGDIPRAFAAFDQVRRPRSQRQVQSARHTGVVYDFQGLGIGDDLEKVKHELGTAREWIWNVDLEAEVKEAERIFHDTSRR